MGTVDREVDAIIFRQQQQLTNEIGQLHKKKAELTDNQESIQHAKLIAKTLSLNFGAALALVSWLEELLKIYPEKRNDKFKNATTRKRLIQLARLVKLSGGQAGLSFVISQIPKYAVKNFQTLIDLDDDWKKKKTHDILDD